MLKKILESCEESIVSRVSNPYFGTYIAVLLIDNWKLFYTLFTFDSFETRESRIAIIADYIAQTGGLSCLFLKCAAIAFFPFAIYYLLLNASRCISNYSELRMKPKLLKLIDQGSVVEKREYDQLVSRVEALRVKFDDELKKRMETENELDNLDKKFKKLQSEHLSSVAEVKDVIEDRKNKHRYQILEEIRAENLDDAFYSLIHRIRLESPIEDDEPIVKYGIKQHLISKSDSGYSFTEEGNAVAKIFLNTYLPKIVK